MSAGVLVFGAAFYALFASGELQSWAVVPDTSMSSAVLDTLLGEDGELMTEEEKAKIKHELIEK